METKKRGFTLVELLISLGILIIIGGASVMVLNTIFLSFAQNNEHIAARSEIEFAINELRPQFTNIGLGMPHKFNMSMSGIKPGMTDTVSVDGVSRDILYYAYAEPTGVLLSGDKHRIESGDISPPTLNLHPPFNMADLQKMGLSGGVVTNANSWILFPSLRIPLHTATGTLTVKPANNTLSGDIRGYEEIHLLRVGRISLSNGQLRQEINGNSKTIAVNIANVSFDFGTTTRLLQMDITASGDLGGSRVIEEKMIWRIIN